MAAVSVRSTRGPRRNPSKPAARSCPRSRGDQPPSGPIAIVQAPRALPRAIRLPQAIAGEAEYAFVFLSSILHAHMDELFSGMKVQGCYQFRVTRNSDLFVEEEERARPGG